MTVYVDDVRHKFGRLVMCHLWADTLPELFEMVDRIGVQRKWFQEPPKASWQHFDISLTKKALAIQYGAVLTDQYGPLEHTARLAFIDAVARQDLNAIHRAAERYTRIAKFRKIRP